MTPNPTPVWPCGGTDKCLCGTAQDIRRQPEPHPVVDPVSNIDVGAETLAIIASAAYWYDEKAGRRDAIHIVVDGVTATLYRDEHDRTHVRIGGGDE